MKKISLIFSIVSMLLITACSNPKTEPTLTDTDKWLNKVKGKSVDGFTPGLIVEKITFNSDGKTPTLQFVASLSYIDQDRFFEKVINENKAIYKTPGGNFQGFEIKEGFLHLTIDVATEDTINWGDTMSGELK